MTKPLLDIEAQLASIEADERIGLLDLPRLTSQQRVYVAARVSGLSRAAASREAGCAPETAKKWEEDPAVIAYREHYEKEMAETSLPRVRFGLDEAHAMYMKAYHLSATATEMVKATDSLVKLHKLNEAPVAPVPKTVSARQLADLPLSELMRLAGMKLDSLAPGDIEGECEEID